MKDGPHIIEDFHDWSPPRLLARKIRAVKKSSRTGMIAHAIIRTGPKSLSLKTPSVVIREGRRELWFASNSSIVRFPSFVELSPGRHILTFSAFRWKGPGSAFDRNIDLALGDVLVVACEPIQPWTIYRESPNADTWHMEII